jgi:hypothetical protein
MASGSLSPLWHLIHCGVSPVRRLPFGMMGKLSTLKFFWWWWWCNCSRLRRQISIVKLTLGLRDSILWPPAFLVCFRSAIASDCSILYWETTVLRRQGSRLNYTLVNMPVESGHSPHHLSTRPSYCPFHSLLMFIQPLPEQSLTLIIL